MAPKKKTAIKKTSALPHVPPNDDTGASEETLSLLEQSSVTKSTSKRATWTAADDATLLDVLKQQRLAGNQADNNWKGCVWTTAAAVLNKNLTVGASKTSKGCKDHWNLVSFVCFTCMNHSTNCLHSLKSISSWLRSFERSQVPAGTQSDTS